MGDVHGLGVIGALSQHGWSPWGRTKAQGTMFHGRESVKYSLNSTCWRIRAQHNGLWLNIGYKVKGEAVLSRSF